MRKKGRGKQDTKEEKAFHDQLISQMVTLATSGFGLVAALAWNDAIQGFVKEFIQPFFPQSAVWWRFIYAAIITSLAVLITYQLSKIASHFGHTEKTP